MKVQLSTAIGDILLELDNSKAPKTVKNFLSYMNSGHYEGTIFHRVIKGFMIQGGGLDVNMNTKPAPDLVENEANNGLSNLKGTIAMARTTEPHSASSQFFINTADNLFLNHKSETDDGWGYCVFGKIIASDEIIEKIEETPTVTRAGHQDVPDNVIIIENITTINE